MNARKLINALIDICAVQNRDPISVEVLMRTHDDSDVEELNFVEEDLFDSATNNILESIVLKSSNLAYELPITKAELSTLERCENAGQWNAAVDEIKKERFGTYPSDWFELVILSGLKGKVMGRWITKEPKGEAKAQEVKPFTMSLGDRAAMRFVRQWLSNQCPLERRLSPNINWFGCRNDAQLREAIENSAIKEGESDLIKVLKIMHYS